MLKSLGVDFEAKAVSAHRTPDLLFDYAASAAAHLPAAQNHRAGTEGAGAFQILKGMDSLLSIVHMPKGIPVARFAIGEAGAANTARLEAFRTEQSVTVLNMSPPA